MALITGIHPQASNLGGIGSLRSRCRRKSLSPQMLFLVVLIIALGWAGWIWAWGRDRFMSNRGFGIAPGPLSGRSASAFGAPRTASMARKRRREVLVALGVSAVLTLLLARGWSALWILHIAIDLALIAYGWAVYNIEQGHPASGRSDGPPSVLRTSPRLSLQPVLEDGFIDAPGPLREPLTSR